MAQLHALRTSMQSALRHAPFGSQPDPAQPPFSASQISAYLDRASASVPTKRLQRMCLDTLRDLEARSRQGVDKRFAVLASLAGERAGKSSAQSPWASLAPSLQQVLWLRHGPDVQRRRLADAPASATLPDAVAAFDPLAKAAARASAWQSLLGLDDALDVLDGDTAEDTDQGDGASCEGGACADEAGDAAFWPDAAAWRRHSQREGTSSGGVHLAKRARVRVDDDTACIGSVAPGLAVSLSVHARHGEMWEARVRVECLGEAKAVRHISFAEDVSVGWPESISGLPPGLAARLRAVATRDVHLSPPALLHGPGCFLEAVVLLPRVPDPHVPEAQPLLRVVDVLTAS